jgi:hypothetical protein
MNYLCTRLLQTALLLTQAPIALAATTWYVNGVNGSDSHNCKSPLTACKTIGHAISSAALGDAITVAAATYVENLTIRVSLTVTGSGAVDTIIDGGDYGTPRGPVVTIPNSGTNVTLSNVTLKNGSAEHGGGVYNTGTLTINNSVISENLATEHNFFPNFNLYGFGGGIYNTGALTINRTTISANAARGLAQAHGGGIYNLGKLTINASTLSGNGADVDCNTQRFNCTVGGGGIANGGTLAVNNSTITGNYTRTGLTNRLEGGGIVGGGSFHSSTITGNLGGIVGAATLQNSIVANNGSGGNCNGPVTSIFSLSSDGTCHLNGPGDVNNTNPRLGTLGYYGGPTQTIALLSGSPAIDAGNPSGCTDGLGHLLKTDQRGLPRPNTEDRSGCDMGAFERQTNTPLLTGYCWGGLSTGPRGHCEVAPDTVQCPIGQSAITPTTDAGCLPPQTQLVDHARACRTQISPRVTLSGSCLAAP